jgi:hypothetical protein
LRYPAYNTKGMTFAQGCAYDLVQPLADETLDIECPDCFNRPEISVNCRLKIVLTHEHFLQARKKGSILVATHEPNALMPGHGIYLMHVGERGKESFQLQAVSNIQTIPVKALVIDEQPAHPSLIAA